MEKEFVLYKQAEELKKLGFKDSVIAYFKKEKYTDTPRNLLFPSADPDIQIRYQQGLQNSNPKLGLTSAPTYSQAFKWFRKKHKINSQIAFCEYGIKSENGWSYTFDNPTGKQYWEGKFKTYEKAELACLKHLIKIIKDK